jgi:hypothetical protein
LFTATGFLKGNHKTILNARLIKTLVNIEHYQYGTWVDDCGITLLFGNKLVRKRNDYQKIIEIILS